MCLVGGTLNLAQLQLPYVSVSLSLGHVASVTPDTQCIYGHLSCRALPTFDQYQITLICQ